MCNPFHHWANSSLVAIGGVNRLGNGVGIDHFGGGTQSFGPTHHLHCIIASQSTSTSFSSSHFAISLSIPRLSWNFMVFATGYQITEENSIMYLLYGLDFLEAVGQRLESGIKLLEAKDL
jgi:hypothetical protein